MSRVLRKARSLGGEEEIKLCKQRKNITEQNEFKQDRISNLKTMTPTDKTEQDWRRPAKTRREDKSRQDEKTSRKNQRQGKEETSRTRRTKLCLLALSLGPNTNRSDLLDHTLNYYFFFSRPHLFLFFPNKIKAVVWKRCRSGSKPSRQNKYMKMEVK